MSDPLVLVTGASGYLGTHVVLLLQEAGFKVRGTVRSTKNEAKIKYLYDLCPSAKYPIELVEADLTKEEGWDKAVEGCTYVHHVASPFTLAGVTHEDEIIKPAVEGTLVVLRACAASGTVRRVILTSSIAAVLCKGGNAEPASEKTWSDEHMPGLPPYYKSKILAERAAWEYVESLPDSQKFELSTTCPSVILGPPLHRHPSATTDFIRQIMERETPMVPKLMMTVIDVRDVALAHLRCQTVSEAGGHRHVISGKTMPLRELAIILDREFRPHGYNIPTGDMPGCLFTVATWFDKALKSAKSFSSDPMLFDNTRMNEVLGVTARDPKGTMIDMGYALIENGFVKKTSKYTGRQSS